MPDSATIDVSALRESELRFRQIVESLPQLVWTCSADGLCDYLSTQWIRYTGKSEAGQLGYGWLTQLHPDDRERVAAQWRAANAEKGENFEIEFRLRRYDGVYRWFRTLAIPLRDKAGRVVKWFGSNTDIEDIKQVEKLLRESEERLRLFIEHAPAAVAMFDGEMRYLAASRRWLSDFRLRGEIAGQSHCALFPGFSDRWKEAHHRGLAGETFHSEGEWFERPEGPGQWVKWDLVPWYTATGNVGGIIVAAEDITERKQAEEALRESEQQFRTLANAIPQLAWMANADGWVYWYNRRWYEYTGATPEQMVGWGWQSVHDPDVLPTVMEQWTAALAAERPAEMVFPLRGADGVFRQFLTRVEPLRNSEGRVVRWFGTTTDVDALKRAEEKLRSSEERYRGIFRYAGTGIAIMDLQGRFQSCNPAYAAMVGYTEEELRHRIFTDLVHPEDREINVTDVRRLLAGDIPSFEITNRYIRKDGRTLWVHKHVSLLRDAVNCPFQIIALATNVTGRKEAEDILQQANEMLEQRVATVLAERAEAEAQLRQAQKMEAVGMLTGGVAHDFNNVLQVISGNLQLLSRDVSGNPPAEQRLQAAIAAISRGSKLASQLLAFGRRQPLAPKVMNLGRLIRSIDDMLRQALDNGVEIDTIISGDLWNTLVDPAQVETAVLNLAINARDAMGGRGKLTVEAGNATLDADYAARHFEVDPGQYVMIAVTDTGCGIPPEIIDRVFEPFFTTKQGTGLGLSMVHGFVKQSGGHIKIYSEPDQGTTVRIYLPRTLEREDIETNVEAGLATGGTETVLVVEDDAEVRRTVVDTLSDLGYQVLKAVDAQSALAIIESGVPIDVLFTDVVMPGPLRSPELARKALERLPNIAVLFTSGYTGNAIVHGGRLEPGIELLSKPYTRVALARKIQYVMRQQEKRRIAQSSSLASQRRTGPHIMIIDDDHDLRLLVREVLQAEGFEVTVAEDGEQGLKLQRKQPASLVITDIFMPNKEGVETIRDFREEFPDIPIIVMSGGGRPGSRASSLFTARELGAKIILQKPFEMSDLIRSVMEVLNRSAPEQQY